MIMKKADFETLFYALYGKERRLIISAIWRFAGYNGTDVAATAPVLCWRTARGVGVIVGMANEQGKFDKDVAAPKLLLTVVDYLMNRETSQTSQNFPKLPKVLGSGVRVLK